MLWHIMSPVKAIFIVVSLDSFFCSCDWLSSELELLSRLRLFSLFVAIWVFSLVSELFILSANIFCFDKFFFILIEEKTKINKNTKIRISKTLLTIVRASIL